MKSYLIPPIIPRILLLNNGELLNKTRKKSKLNGFHYISYSANKRSEDSAESVTYNQRHETLSLLRMTIILSKPI